MEIAEKGCRKLNMGEVKWCPEIQRARDRIRYYHSIYFEFVPVEKKMQGTMASKSTSKSLKHLKNLIVMIEKLMVGQKSSKPTVRWYQTLNWNL